MSAVVPGIYAIERGTLDALLSGAIHAVVRESRTGFRAPAGTAVVVISGPIELRRGVLAEMLGSGTSSSELRAAFAALEHDSQTNTVLLLVDSPGGDVIGSEEAAAAVRSLAKKKRVVAMVDGIAASAAYWIVSGASEIVVTPSGSVGSVGVYAAHEDLSEAAKKLGVRTTLVASSPEKVEGNPYEPLADAARLDMQHKVNAYARTFEQDVAIGRRTTLADVRANFGKGRMVLARDAVVAGMADRVGTVDGALQELAIERGKFVAEMDVRRRRLSAYRETLTRRG
jgi:signal peptide peptidase SppA